jgi:adenosylcobinamide-GDP ribazoletransferase
MKTLLKNRVLLDFFASLMFFTRIPVNWKFFSNKPPNLTSAAWSFPLIGFLIGIISGFIGDLCIIMNLSIFLSCTIAIAFSVIITGAFHEDGLADMADGFGAGGSPEKINKIIHDSRLGTYGTTALTLGLLIRLGLAINMVELGYSLILILSSSFASGKLSIIYTRNFFSVSTFSKTGSIIEIVPTKMLVVASLIWLIPMVYFFPFWAILLGVFLISVVIFFIGKMSQKKIGGITGDVLGAIAFTTELVFLFGIIIYLRHLH